MAITRYTVLQLADQIIRLMERGSVKVTKPFDRREIARVIRDVTSELLRGSYSEHLIAGTNQIYQQYVAIFEEIEVKNRSEKIYYAELPADPEDLPDNEGIMNVWPNTGKYEKDSVAMIPLPLNANVILGGLPAGTLQQQFGFLPFRDRIEFTTIKVGEKERTVADEGIKKVNIQMVTTGPANTADDEPFPMSPHLRPMLILRVFAMFGAPEQELNRILEEQNENR